MVVAARASNYEGPWIPHVGRGTRGKAHIAGVDGADGGDTIFESGEIRLVAPGGKGGLAGSGERKVSDKLLVSALMPANYVAVDHGLAHVINGAWSYYDVVLIPTPMSLALICVIEAGGVDVGEYTIAFEVHSPSGQKRTRLSLALSIDEQGDLNRIPCHCALSFEVDELGMWRVTALSDVKRLAAIDVLIKQPDLVTTT
ncbi:hypothetical protein [Mycobacterium ahvazicum]|nr:hypothetical protein [Mycobacterium ahvazicum]